MECQSSIGVTTGILFCGVVGHPQRHEYTGTESIYLSSFLPLLCVSVIGQKVNLAARLMMKFSGCITCDEVTMTKSALSPDQFKLQPNITLKGITNPENIYKFSPEQ